MNIYIITEKFKYGVLANWPSPYTFKKNYILYIYFAKSIYKCYAEALREFVVSFYAKTLHIAYTFCNTVKVYLPFNAAATINQ